jgi:hypothetical protein
MAKAKTLVGLDVHATKIVAAVLDADTGELQTFAMGGDTAGAAGFCAWRASSQSPALSVRSRHRARSRGRAGIA